MGEFIALIAVGSTAAAGLIIVIGVTVRIVFSPILKAKRLAATTAASAPEATARLEARLGALEEEMRQQGEALERVIAAVEFDTQLRAGASGDAPRLPQA